MIKIKDHNLYYKLFSKLNFQYGVNINLSVLKEIFEKYYPSADVANKILIYGLYYNVNENEKEKLKILKDILYSTFGNYLGCDFKKDIDNLYTSKYILEGGTRIIDKYFCTNNKSNEVKKSNLEYCYDSLESNKTH